MIDLILIAISIGAGWAAFRMACVLLGVIFNGD